jgi:hypothetical protein
MHAKKIKEIIAFTIIPIIFLWGFNSLIIPPSAREQSMGGIGSISAVGPSAMYYNPSLTGALDVLTIGVNFKRWILDTYYQSFFITKPLSRFNLGIGIISFNAGTIEMRGPWPSDEIIGTFSPNDFSLYLNFSHKINYNNRFFCVGITPRFYYSKIHEYTASTYGIDLGMSLPILPQLRWGISFIDFGGRLKYLRTSMNLPTRFISGLEYQLLSKPESLLRIKTGFDFIYLIYDRQTKLNWGMEIGFYNKYFLRTGFKVNNKNEHITFGLGIAAQKFKIDYAWMPFQLNLGAAHHLSIGFGY